MPEKPLLEIVLANPRGFCAGVDRAIQIVERSLERFGPPVYVRHEIVHNRFVVAALQKKGAVFVEELSEVPEGVPVIFSAHGVPKTVTDEARRREMIAIDATCPLVTKVHREVERHNAAGRQVVLIGHAGHPEVVGTMGQAGPEAVVLVEDLAGVETVTVRDPEKLAFVTQTTLSVDDTAGIVAALKGRFPAIAGPRREDICYATTNRQEAVKAIAGRCDALIVIGAPNSSNSRRLVEVARRAGVAKAILVQRAADIDWAMMEGVKCLGLTAGASAPEVLVDEVLAACQARFDVSISSLTVTVEDTVFQLPSELRTETA